MKSRSRLNFSTALLVTALVLVVACSRTSVEQKLSLDSPEPASTTSTTLISSPVSNEDAFTINPQQRLKFEHISVEQGLSQSTVNCILQDSLGFLWFGTPDGLNRYDGYNFKVYRHDSQNPNSLSDNHIMALAEDQEGVLWIATRGGGLNRYDRLTDTFTHDLHNPYDRSSLTNDWVASLYIDRNGILWVGTGDGLDRFESEQQRFVHVRREPQTSNTLMYKMIETIYQDSDGMIWIGTNSDGLYCLDPTTERLTRFQHNPDDPNSLSSDMLVNAILEDANGNLWIGTFDGLNKLDRETSQVVRYQHDPDNPNSLSNNVVWSLIVDSSGALWVGTYSGGLDRMNPVTGQFTHYRHATDDPDGLNSNTILSLYQDRVGILWVGTGGGGVNKLSPLTERFTRHQNDPGNANSLSNNSVLALLGDEDGVLWIGTIGGGLNRFDRETQTWRTYRNIPDNSASLSHDNVAAICEDRQGALWIGTLGGGLNRFDRETDSFTHYPNSPDDPFDLDSPMIYAIVEGRDNTLWIATGGSPNGSLHRFDPQTQEIVHYRYNPNDFQSINNSVVQAIYEDRTGALWASTLEKGLNVLNPSTGRFTRYMHDPDNPTSLSSDAVTGIYEDQTGTVWIGTDTGLDKFDRERQTFAHYTVEDGLPGNVIYGILDDSEGRLWLSTNNGLSKFDPAAETFRNYDVRDGLQGNVFNIRAHFKSLSGEIFFGGVNGFNTFHPEQIADNPIVPPVVLTALIQNGEDIPLGTATEIAGSVTFRWPDTTFEFEFASLNFIQPEKNQHAYMLEGFDKDWSYIGNRRYGKYTNLPPGTYTLRLKGSNNDGIWNETGASVTIYVIPPFWRTVWFQGILLLIAGGAIWGGYRWRVRSVELRSRELERQVAERTSELIQANVALEKEIGERRRTEEALAQERAAAAVVTERTRLARDLHDSATQSLYAVTLYADAVTRLLSSGQTESVAENVRKLRETAKDALGEMRMLIFELRPPILEVAGLAAALEARLEAVEGRAGLKVALHVEGEERLRPDVEEGLYRIAVEALNNALRHAQATCISVSLHFKPEDMLLEITDDGKGFDLEEAKASGGLGLQGMAERAEEMGTMLEINTQVGQGTRIRVLGRDNEK